MIFFPVCKSVGNVAQDNKKIHYMRIVSVIEKSLENFLTNFNFDYEMKKIDFTFSNTYVCIGSTWNSRNDTEDFVRFFTHSK